MTSMTILEALQIAVQRHQAGRLAEAEGLYRQILAMQPKHADALHFLGVIAHQVGRHDLAVDLIGQSIALGPNNPAAYCNLGEAYRTLGRLDDTVAANRRALELNPEFPEGHNNLGAALRELGRLDEAATACRRALALKPNFPEACNNLGIALRDLGQLEEAISAFLRALDLKPAFPEAHDNLGIALKGLGRLGEAIAAHRRALELKPDCAEAHNNLGAALVEQGQFDEAISAYRRALQVRPAFWEALNNLGNALRERGQWGEAIGAYRRALDLKPDYPEVLNNLGAALAGQGQLDEAITAYRRALELKSDYPEAHFNLGITLRERGQVDEAIAAYRRALELKSDYPEALNNLGAALAGQGQIDEAITAYRHALGLNPENAWVHSNLVYTLQFHPDHDATTISEERERWNYRFGEPVKPFALPHANDRSPKRPLRIGYVSPDFRDHVVGRYLLPLFKRHDRRNFEIVCYSGVTRPDPLTEEFRQRAGQWRTTVGVGDEALADMIRRDGVDILVDLTQHMAGNRLPVFARKPAPIQVSFAGYPDRTGLEAIEHRISDRHLAGGSAEMGAGSKEQIHLIDSFYCYDPCGVEVEVNSLPALESGTVTFGCLNHFRKVNEQVLSLWGRVLRKVRDSRLMISSSAGSPRQRTLEALERQGVAAGRVEFVDFRPRQEYLELHHRLDVILDTFPYNGGVTTCDALWMGVPVVSLAGETPVSRAGLSLLSNIGWPELVARSELEYVKIAAGLAEDLPRLADLRSTLRERMKNSVLMDAPRFARNVEAAYRKMWQAWSRKESPRPKEL